MRTQFILALPDEEIDCSCLLSLVSVFLFQLRTECLSVLVCTLDPTQHCMRNCIMLGRVCMIICRAVIFSLVVEFRSILRLMYSTDRQISEETTCVDLGARYLYFRYFSVPTIDGDMYKVAISVE